MPLEDLKKQRLLLPERHWDRGPTTPGRREALVLLAGALGFAAALLTWVGSGSWLTFAGLGLFLADLLFFLLLTFRTVDAQYRRLVDLGAGGVVDGVEEP